ncbi:GNAT family N-acetyltransferase [Marinilactibacillus kalidii]|uniref:GNAT family N-acetyltransferase n=1 Tax=Marinilactibacillus kalidii TaxID=2820274 RepID=UPI001ABDEDDE|nr:GNAT family protein [Marinilactibacillus kalidii]
MAQYMGLNVEQNLDLIHPELLMADELFKLVDSDREHLRAFLTFVDSSVDSSTQKDYIKMKMNGAANGTDKLFFIFKDDKIIGCIDLHNMDFTNGKAEIGYWIHSSYAGQNIISKVVKEICTYSFEILKLNKLVIFADVENIPSNKVALKTGFKLVGTKLQDMVLHDQYRDMNEYYLLKNDFIH